MPAQLIPNISVVIPTYNRKASMLLTLESLARQSFPLSHFEVVVVDDGSSDGTDALRDLSFPFRYIYVRQPNRGAAAARNRGASRSHGEILLFIDDDITLLPGYLAAIGLKTKSGMVTMGVWQPYQTLDPSPFSRTTARRIQTEAARITEDQTVPYTECTSNNLALHRRDFEQVGMWEDVLGDGPTLWGDVEFGYRAWTHGCHFVRVAGAKLIHRDRHVADLSSATQRAYRVSRSVQKLYALHPEIEGHLPMFDDKGPIAWRGDPPRLVARKVARKIVSSSFVYHGMEWLARVLQVRCPSAAILEPLYRWIVSSYIYRGYRRGLRESN